MNALLTLLPLMFSPATDSGLELAADEVSIPVRLDSGHVAVEVVIDGHKLLFQVDTYASIEACLDDDVAKTLGLQQIGTVQNSDGVQVHEKPLVEIERLQCGGAVFSNLRALVADYDWIKRPDGRQVAGLLGFPAFREVLLTFDYPERKLVLHKGQLDPDAPHVVPYYAPNGAPDIELVLGGEALRLGIDTGCRSALRLRREDERLLDLIAEPKVVGKSRTVHAAYTIWGARLKGDLSLADHSIGSFEVIFSDAGAHRLIGYEAFKPFAMTFDQRQQLVSFERPAH